MFNKKLLKTVAVASLVGLSTVNLIGCKEKVEEVKIIKEQEVEQKETIKIDDMEVTMAPLQPSLQLELPTEPETKEAPEVKEEIHEEQKEQVDNTGVEDTPPPQPLYEAVKNPTTGASYAYYPTEGRWVSADGRKKVIERAEAIRDGKMDSKGNTDVRKLTAEERAEIAAGIARAMGAE